MTGRQRPMKNETQPQLSSVPHWIKVIDPAGLWTQAPCVNLRGRSGFGGGQRQKPSSPCEQPRAVKDAARRPSPWRPEEDSALKTNNQPSDTAPPGTHRLSVKTCTPPSSFLTHPSCPSLSPRQTLHSSAVDTINIKRTNSIPNHEGAFLCVTTM